jgi:hypothetical protein
VRHSLLRSAVLSLTVVIVAGTADAATFTLNANTSGNASAWVITGAGAVNAPAMQRSGEISITDTAHEDGNFISGGSLAQFDGAWYADFLFNLPADATNVSLVFSGLRGDDKTVLMLNGSIVGDNGSNGLPARTGTGLFVYAPGGADVNYTFVGVTDATLTTGFILGGQNDLRLIVNNTNSSDLSTHAKTFQGTGDATDVSMAGTISFDSNTVPEPAPLSMIAFGAAVLISKRRHYNGSPLNPFFPSNNPDPLPRH